MAIRSVVDIVKQSLPWLSDGSKDTVISAVQSEQYHYLENHLGQKGESDAEIEDEGNYSAKQNMLIAEMVKYRMGESWVAEVMGGTSSTASVQKMLKKAKADVVESEFMQIDTGKGTFTLPTAEWFNMILKNICDMSRELDIANPMCFDPDSVNNLTPFIKGSDFPPSKKDPYDILNGTIGN